MINVIAKRRVNARIGSPNVNAPKGIPLEKGMQVIVDDLPVQGDLFEGSRLWFRDNNNRFFWSGGFELPLPHETLFSSPAIAHRKIPFLPPAQIDDNKLCWSIKDYGIKNIWKKTYGESVRIAVLDSGIQTNNTDLQNVVTNGWNFVDNNADVTDTLGHGTNVAGIIAAQGQNIFGVAPAAELLVAKIYNGFFFNDELIFKGIEWALKNKADIISMSFTFSGASEKIKQLITTNINRCVFIAACGDEGELSFNINNFPASYPGVISVGALAQDNKRYFRSSKSENLDVMAPGENIWSAGLNNSAVKTLSDTSFSAPFITGLTALLISAYKKNSVLFPFIGYKKNIQNSCEFTTGQTQKNVECGFGKINTAKLIANLNLNL